MNALTEIPRGGRPAQPVDLELGGRVCERLAEGASLAEIRNEFGVHAYSLTLWAQKSDTFAEMYARARLAKADTLADAIVPLADSALGKDSAGVQAIKGMVDARKWAASKFNPHAYGDKLDVTSKGEALAAPSHQIDARVQSIVMQAAMRMQGALEPEIASLLD